MSCSKKCDAPWEGAAKASWKANYKGAIKIPGRLGANAVHIYRPQIYLYYPQKKGKKNGVPDQGTPSNSHATTTSVAAPQGAEFII
jgi:hypothetical protein